MLQCRTNLMAACYKQKKVVPCLFKKIWLLLLLCWGSAGQATLPMGDLPPCQPLRALVAFGGPMTVPVEAATAQQDVLRNTINAVGTLTVESGVIMRPEISGVVKDILFKDGQSVTKGQPLLQLDDSVYRAQLGEAQAALALAERTNSRADALSKRGAGTEQSRDEAALPSCAAPLPLWHWPKPIWKKPLLSLRLMVWWAFARSALVTM
jgi:multidrug efflux pump subunit AcrA (membrane-fusion protein)